MGRFINRLITFLICTQVMLQINFMPLVAGGKNFEIYITNELKPGAQPVTFRCQEKGFDYGTKVLQQRQTFGFNFETELFLKKLIFCHFYWTTYQITFDLFSERIDRKSGHVCFWEIREDGFYRRCEGKPPVWVKMHDWSK